MEGLSWFGSNLTLRMHLRGISKLLEPYTKLIPNITKVVEPLKGYKWRHSHGEQGRKKSTNHCYYDRGYFEQELDEEDLERLLQYHLKIVNFLFKVLIKILGLFPSSMCLHVLVYACLNLHRYIDFV
jgi:hypothetical protein